MVGSLASLLYRVLLSNLAALAAPYKLTYAVTYRCNQRCAACHIWKRRSTGELSLAEIDRFFASSKGFSWVDLTGGEVFLRSDIEEIILTIIRRLPDLYMLHFPTNGLLTERILSTVDRVLLEPSRPPRLIVSVSLDGPEELHDRLRGTPGGWRKALATYSALRRMPGVDVYLGMTLSRANMDHIAQTYAAVLEHSPDLTYTDLHVNLMHESPHFYGNVASDLTPSGQDRQRLEAALGDILSRRGASLNPVLILERQYLKLIPAYLRSGRSPVQCQALSASCFVDPYGDVYPCAIWDKKLFNLRDVDYSLRRAWTMALIREPRRGIRAGRCPNCWTPCEAYQSILGSLPRILLPRTTPTGPK
ncbi:radical SAM protein [Planctomycetota bacterium]